MVQYFFELQIPAGLISLWSGSVASIPDGWVICDGNNNTPDLRNNFVVGAGDTYDPEDTGGATTHDHTGITGEPSATTQTGAKAGSELIFPDRDHTHTISSDSNLPPYYALAYIMKT
jgi:hypothetical protein